MLCKLQAQQYENPYAVFGYDKVKVLDMPYYEKYYTVDCVDSLGRKYTIELHPNFNTYIIYNSIGEKMSCDNIPYDKVARFISTDPLEGSFPYYSPYQYAGDKPIRCTDLDGLEEFSRVEYYFNGTLFYQKTILTPPNSQATDPNTGQKITTGIYTQNVMLNQANFQQQFLSNKISPETFSNIPSNQISQNPQSFLSANQMADLRGGTVSSVFTHFAFRTNINFAPDDASTQQVQTTYNINAQTRSQIDAIVIQLIDRPNSIVTITGNADANTSNYQGYLQNPLNPYNPNTTAQGGPLPIPLDANGNPDLNVPLTWDRSFAMAQFIQQSVNQLSGGQVNVNMNNFNIQAAGSTNATGNNTNDRNVNLAIRIR